MVDGQPVRAATESEAIGVGLELGDERDHIAAWLLDFPGCVASSSDRTAALACVPATMGRFAAWLAAHGESCNVPATERVDIREEIATEVVAGYERSATFADDRRPAAPDEVEAALRRLDLARADVLALLPRIDAWQQVNGALPTLDQPGGGGAPSGAFAAERTSDDVLRHLAGTEMWLGTRLGHSRYDGPARYAEIRPYLDATHAWAMAQVREVQDTDPSAHAFDGRGEEWTLPKVLRRLVSHALDHFVELDRRLARVERAADALVLRTDEPIEASDIEPLFRSVGWYHLVGEDGCIGQLLAGSTAVATAVDGDHIVGFARAISDKAAAGLISEVAVHPLWQGKGVGHRLIAALLENNDGIQFSLSADPGLESPYASFGFVRDERALVRRRLS
jgi:GNAT superfamily N-acetyltransferase